MSLARAGWLASLCLATACNSPGESLFPPFARTGPYDHFSDQDWERVEAARADWDAGELRVARAGLSYVAADNPRNIAVAVMLQELELELLERGTALLDLGIGADAPDAQERLRRIYRERADQAQTPESLVLAARVEPDAPAARALLRDAVERDPDCAWADYGLSHLAFAAGEFRSAQTTLARALESDPTLLPARRLRARMLARSASADVGLRSTRLWLDDARESPFVRPREVAEAEFDLALLYAQDDQSDEVEEVCARLLEAGLVDPAPVYLILAATRIAEGEVELALRAARNASRVAPHSALAHVQRALVFEDWQARPEKAYDAWVRALEAASGKPQRAPDTRDEPDLVVVEPGESGPGARERPDPEGIRDVQLWLLARTRLARLDRRGIRGSTSRVAEPR